MPILSNRNLWGALAGFGVASILSGIGILAATDTEHRIALSMIRRIREGVLVNDPLVGKLLAIYENAT